MVNFITLLDLSPFEFYLLLEDKVKEYLKLEGEDPPLSERFIERFFEWDVPYTKDRNVVKKGRVPFKMIDIMTSKPDALVIHFMDSWRVTIGQIYINVRTKECKFETWDDYGYGFRYGAETIRETIHYSVPRYYRDRVVEKWP